jgi:hypothetical protein
VLIKQEGEILDVPTAEYLRKMRVLHDLSVYEMAAGELSVAESGHRPIGGRC